MSDSGQDHLSNELRLEASLSERGISGSVRSRAAAAIDRLLGSLFDIPAAKWEAVTKRTRAQSDQEIKLISSEISAIEKEIEDDNDFRHRIAEDYLLSRVKYISNKNNVTHLAIEHLSKEKPHEEQDSGVNFEEDWLNYFEQYAEKASSERMQDLWARVLAGEIRKPRSFSLVTLRFLAELDKEIATKFEEKTKYRFGDGFILNPDSAQMKGEFFLDFTFLEEVGLLQDVTTGLRQTKAPNDGVVVWREGDFLLEVETEKEIHLNTIRITRIGREITNILPPTNKVSVPEQIAKKIEDKIKCSEIYQIVRDNNDGTSLLHKVKTIKAKVD